MSIGASFWPASQGRAVLGGVAAQADGQGEVGTVIRPYLDFSGKKLDVRQRPRMRGANIGNTPGEEHDRSRNCYRK